MRNMVRIPSTDDSDVKLNVSRQLEPLEFHCFDEFLGMKSRNDVEWVLELVMQ